MDFDQSEDRRMLAETLSRYLADRYDVATRIKLAYDAPYHSPERWAEMAELGILHALVSEDHGGMGGHGFDIATVFEELGRTLCPEPVLPALMGLRLLAAAGADLEPALTGAEMLAVAIGEPEAPWDLDALETRAETAGDGWVLTGRKSVVYGGHVASRLLVAARADGGLGLFEVRAGDAEITAYGMIDGGGAAEIFLDATPARLLIADARDAFDSALNAGRVALCAEAVGAMDATKDLLLDYLRTRKQFGRTIGSFQVLQHRTVDLVTEIEQARSITILAADALDGPEAGRRASMAKNLIGRAARLVAEEAIQMHGGIAMTWEAAVSHYGKRLVMIDAQLGDTDFHLTRVMEGLQA
ncbi:acyl-CoA dehydrogenase [Defluviimonas sp. 20V17]|uniref:Acyl-CoA dehydrogenase n=1 Tax=Allgaiera indica TaxID=765699 RepID=A0AAN4UUC9_9RHOB|nr:acyl-CoA dehydrogenase family protein [Allgaiera indica]KDB05219.1 acyl-CoA dehydrogenase [Defluviimonas sp. 20V17]GHE04956.1 acyl-CoA dehydrogenase [Allgaiera indica]SDX60194.1 Acyl-CoA dehydrogenase [Allgaiera indica]